VPARRKFLKSDNVEFKHIVTEFTRVALTRPGVGFTLTHNGKDVCVLRPAKSLKFRIQDVLGANVANDVVDVHTQTSIVEVTGYVGRPEAARKGLGNQYFFVNGRYFKSAYLHKAVMKAYENLIPEGVTPSYFIYLEVDPQSIDVNIHPTKTEIKFEDDSVVFQILFACIKESLGKNSFGFGIDFDREGAPDIPAFGRNFDEFRSVDEPQAVGDPSFNPFDNDGFPSEASVFDNGFVSGGFGSSASSYQPANSENEWSKAEASFGQAQHYAAQPQQFMEKRDDYGKLFEDRFMPGKAVILLQGKYILTPAKSGLMAVNVQRAMERILFDRFLSSLSMNAHVTQTALFPVTVRVGMENIYLFAEHSQMLAGLGFDIAPFGTDTIVVNGVPEGFSAEAGKVQETVEDVMQILSEDHNSLPELMTANMASKFAALGARNCDCLTNPAEAQRLIDNLFACENPEYTSQGRKIISIIPMEEIDRKF
jgi:DNA mismatch repair protein MutL